ncbi:MAG: O-linked acetylglucosamine transferase [Rhodospirillales bacterium]|nr:O-linked acetylglucosamine transferase [Rhodospirillales bacterium]
MEPDMLAAPVLSSERAWFASLMCGAGWPLEGSDDAERLRAYCAVLPLETLLPLTEQASRQGHRAATVAAYRTWIVANPSGPQIFAAWFNLGVELAQTRDHAAAAQAYSQALVLQPKLDQAAVNLGLALEAQGQPDAALAVWDQALQSTAMRVALLNHRGRLLDERKRFTEAEAALRASLLLDPAQPDVVQHWGHARQKGCIWPLYSGEIPGLTAEEFALQIGPLGALALTDDVALQRRSVAGWLARKVAPALHRLSPERGYRHDRIRLGYLSSDFCAHAMSFLIVETLERHDRTAFEVFGYCSSPEDGSAIRARVVAALDHHVPIGHLDDTTAAHRIRADEIDILIDLNGLTKGARMHTLRHKPAPVQATYLGYIGPLPLPELDYIICDHWVIPPDQAGHYAPKPLPLSGLYQANDSRMPELPVLSRTSEGLPKGRFVFCCFSHHYKITESMFKTWCAILRAAEDSVLWIVEDTEDSKANLLARAASLGVEPGRFIFAPRVGPAHYMARFALADLFLDTSPYNAGTVASDALRMGLPILTLSGRAFASRMAGALLHAVGLDDCVTTTHSDYATRASEIANIPALAAQLRQRLAGDAWRRSIGDSASFTARLEAAYRAIRLVP